MRRKRNQSTAAAQKIMKERNYNLELIRMSAFLMVIAIHVTNYFCRAYGEVTKEEYQAEGIYIEGFVPRELYGKVN